MLDTMYRQEYLRVRVIDNQVIVEEENGNNTQLVLKECYFWKGIIFSWLMILILKTHRDI